MVAYDQTKKMWVAKCLSDASAQSYKRLKYYELVVKTSHFGSRKLVHRDNNSGSDTIQTIYISIRTRAHSSLNNG